jgi:hypothetical protein
MNSQALGNLQGGLAGIFGGLFGNSGQPYQDAMNQYQNWTNQAASYQNPYIQAGNAAIPNYQNWLTSMQNPSQFINGLMNQYQESPYAKYQQQQSMRAAQNIGSASGLTGSTPLQLQAQQNASNISSQDQNQWLQNVLGVNTQYGAGNQYLIGTGANSANALTNLYGSGAGNMAQLAYGKGAGQQSNFWDLLGGGLDLLGI